MTTPEAPRSSDYCAAWPMPVCEFAIVESTSHGLALNRLDHVEYDIAAFTTSPATTGLPQDLRGLPRSKGRLFEALDTALHKGIAKTAVVNADDLPRTTCSNAPRRAATFGLEARDAMVSARELVLRPDGADFRLMTPRGAAEPSTVAGCLQRDERPGGCIRWASPAALIPETSPAASANAPGYLAAWSASSRASRSR